jgi:hypothetical protein
MKSKLPIYVEKQIEECLLKNQKHPINYWRRFAGVGDKNIELIKQRGVVEEEKLDELQHIQMARHILMMQGFETLDQILAGFLEGKIYAKAFRNYGARSHQHICDILIRWLAK